MALSFLAALLLLSLQPGFLTTADRCPYDRRIQHVCGGIYQRTESWICIEVARG